MKFIAMRVTGALVAIAAAAPAWAQCVTSCETPVVYQGQPATLRLNVTASVGGRCGFATAPSATLDFPNFDSGSATKSASFRLDCTGPSRVAVTSSNGGLKNGSATLPSGYSNLASYRINLRLTPTTGSTVTLAQACPAEVLRVSSPASGTVECAGVRGTASFNGMTGLWLGSASIGRDSFLDVQVGPETIAPSGPAPVMIDGNYSDTLTVTVAASL
jgi:spore coat protein U-like protein